MTAAKAPGWATVIGQPYMDMSQAFSTSPMLSPVTMNIVLSLALLDSSRLCTSPRAGVGREQPGPVGVLEVADPVGDAEVAEVGDGRHPLRVERREGLVGERPVVPPRPGVGREVGRPVAQALDPELVEQPEVVLPALVVIALR